MVWFGLPPISTSWRVRYLPESLTVVAPATSANLGPGFDALAVALDLVNIVTVTRRPGPLEVRVVGEGADEVQCDETNLVCRALESGLGTLDGLVVECENRIPLGRGLGSSAAAVCSGLAAANAIGRLRWSPAEMLARAAAVEGHADNAAACLEGGFIAVAPGPRAIRLPSPADLVFVVVIPEAQTSTSAARGALPASVPHADAAYTVGRAIGLAILLERGEIDDIGLMLDDRLHEPYRGPDIPGLSQLRALVDGQQCLGATISGSGPSVLMWTRVAGSADLVKRASEVMSAHSPGAVVRTLRIAPGGIRARWTDTPPTALARAPG